MVEVQNVGQSNLSILISLLVFPCYYIWVRTNCDIRFINHTRKIARWTCSSVRGSNEPSKPIRIKKMHSHLIICDNVCQYKTILTQLILMIAHNDTEYWQWTQIHGKRTESYTNDGESVFSFCSKISHNDIGEILLKLALNINQLIPQVYVTLADCGHFGFLFNLFSFPIVWLC